MVTREANGTIYTHAGPEIGVASTKAFTAQLTALFVLAVPGANARHVHPRTGQELLSELSPCPRKLETVLAREEEPRSWPGLPARQDFLFLGRGIHYPIALEGALKLKEISYIHAEGYPAGEMKHGPNALIDEDLPVVIMATRDKNDPGSMRATRRRCPTSKRSKRAPARDRAWPPKATTRFTRPPITRCLCRQRRNCSRRSEDRAAAIAGLSHRRAPRMRRGSAPKPGQSP